MANRYLLSVIGLAPCSNIFADANLIMATHLSKAEIIYNSSYSFYLYFSNHAAPPTDATICAGGWGSGGGGRGYHALRILMCLIINFFCTVRAKYNYMACKRGGRKVALSYIPYYQ